VKYTVDTLSAQQSHQYNDVMKYKVDSEPVTVQVLDVNGTVVSRSSGSTGTLLINNVQLWWPYTMNNHRSPYLYTLQVDMLRLIFLCRLSKLYVTALPVLFTYL